MKSKGKVYFVGAGPGDAGLMTVRGAELLGRAEVVVYDQSVNPALLAMASPTAELIANRDAEAAGNQAALKELLTGKAREGKSVVRLQGGDPYVFGHGGEEAEALAAAHVPFEVVPGVSAAVAGPNYARPLFGQRVVVTRARNQAGQLTQELIELGAQVLEIPTIKFVPPDDKEALAEALLGLGEYDWLVFTSPNGVTTFFDYFLKGFQDVRAIGNVRIAAVGPGTAAKIKEYHLRVDVMPQENLGRKIAEAMQKFESIENLKILLLRAEVANTELPAALQEMGAIVDDVACYKTVPETEDRTGAAAQLQAVGADWIVFTSGSTVENFHARFDLPKITKQFPHIKLASIGPETSKALTALGLQPTVEAKHHNLEGVVQALERYVKEHAA